MLHVGDKAPLGLHVLDSEGKRASLAPFAGRYVILYFYPENESADCVRQARSVRDVHDQIKRYGAVVIGVSPDPPASHRAFRTRHDINFPLWSDPAYALMEAFGARRTIQFMGDTYSYLAPSTVAIHPDGTVARIWETNHPERHGEDIVAFLRSADPKAPSRSA
ncbi:peroxiredoxin [Candidatus Parcubacteria bacterium]|nr:MAG: peroxiredoxin [Candidatus Parcubacteria bacterium]